MTDMLFTYSVTPILVGATENYAIASPSHNPQDHRLVSLIQDLHDHSHQLFTVYPPLFNCTSHQGLVGLWSAGPSCHHYPLSVLPPQHKCFLFTASSEADVTVHCSPSHSSPIRWTSNVQNTKYPSTSSSFSAAYPWLGHVTAGYMRYSRGPSTQQHFFLWQRWKPKAELLVGQTGPSGACDYLRTCPMESPPERCSVPGASMARSPSLPATWLKMPQPQSLSLRLVSDQDDQPGISFRLRPTRPHGWSPSH